MPYRQAQAAIDWIATECVPAGLREEFIAEAQRHVFNPAHADLWTKDTLSEYLFELRVKYLRRAERIERRTQLTTCGSYRMNILGNRRCPHCDGFHRG